MAKEDYRIHNIGNKMLRRLRGLLDKFKTKFYRYQDVKLFLTSKHMIMIILQLHDPRCRKLLFIIARANQQASAINTARSIKRNTNDDNSIIIKIHFALYFFSIHIHFYQHW